MKPWRMRLLTCTAAVRAATVMRATAFIAMFRCANALVISTHAVPCDRDARTTYPEFNANTTPRMRGAFHHAP